MTSSDPLLQPFQLRHLTLRNRIMSPSHEPAYAEDGKPKLRYQLYHEEKAKGGIALSMFGGSTNVAPDSPPIFGQLYAGDDDIIPWFQQLADRMHAHGAATMVQLTHLGRRTVWNDGDWLPTISASSVREPAHRSFPKEMEEADIRRVVAAFSDAARRCKEGGLDGLELEAYGHLIDQFWSPLVNRRADRYGGSLENRMRFSIEVLEAIRAKVGDEFIVGIRMTGGEDVEGGLTEEDGLTIASTLARTGMIDFINIIKGSIATDERISHVIPGLGTPFGPALQFAGRFRERVDLPIFHAARIADVATARYAITEGLLDMVGMMRAHMADPHIVRKLEAGEAERIRPCVGASFCINRLYQGLDALCIHNPATGREETIPHITPPSRGPRRRVVVVGAGPAGLEAARVAAERGHQVTLLEAAREPGGQIQLAARSTPRHGELIGIIEWLAAECRILGVDLRCDTVVEGTDVATLDPDVVIVATGGRPRYPDLTEGEDLVVSTWDIIGGSVTPSHGEVLVFDDHGAEEGLSCVERLVMAGATVEIVSPDRLIGQEVTGTAYPAYLKVFYEAGVRMTPDHRLVAVRRTADRRLEVDLSNDYTGGKQHRIVDQVIVEHGSVPNAEVYAALVDGSRNGGELDLEAYIAGRPQERVVNEIGRYQLFRIGDAVASRNIHAAIYDARRIAMAL
ncbi:MAG: N-methylproline demethylase [Chloroflexi bacterium RBG_16_69_14]|nr:MAG: N-methylproline demethylase [Chloroflexi bacterium RBG_16_69_14]